MGVAHMALRCKGGRDRIECAHFAEIPKTFFGSFGADPSRTTQTLRAFRRANVWAKRISWPWRCELRVAVMAAGGGGGYFGGGGGAGGGGGGVFARGGDAVCSQARR